MSERQRNSPETAGDVAKTVVDHLILITSGAEPDEWLAKYLAVQSALAIGRLSDAVREHWRLVDLGVKPKWLASQQLATKLNSALGNLARLLELPNPGEKEIRLDDLPKDVTELGTIAEEEKRSFQASLRSFRRDPLEDDPSFAEVLSAASEQARAELADHPMNGGFGFCKVFWQKKQQILRQQYGLEWRCPAEMNPDICYD